MKLEDIYIDLSKCSGELIKNIAMTINNNMYSISPEVYNEMINGRYDKFFPFLAYHDYWQYTYYVRGKIELTYPEFIKLFEGEHGETEFDIEKLAKESLKFQHKNIQDRMIDFVLGFEEGFKKAMEINSKQ